MSFENDVMLIILIILLNLAITLLLHYQRQILGAGNLPQDSAPVCININNSPEMAAHSAQRNQAFCVTASDWSPITSAFDSASK